MKLCKVHFPLQVGKEDTFVFVQIKLLIALLFFKTIIQCFAVVISVTPVYISDSSSKGFLSTKLSIGMLCFTLLQASC